MTKKTSPKNSSQKPPEKRKGNILQYPAELLSPIGKFLVSQVKNLEHRDKELTQEDPFSDTERIINNASPDSDAAEQFGHARSEAIKQEIHRKLIQTRKALSRIKIGKYGICESCNQMIDTDRLVIYPEATLCVSCERKKEKSA